MMPDQNFLILNGDFFFSARRQHGLRFLQSVAIFHQQITEQDLAVLLAKTLAGGVRLGKKGLCLPQGAIFRQRPDRVDQVG